jgi:transketolase
MNATSTAIAWDAPTDAESTVFATGVTVPEGKAAADELGDEIAVRVVDVYSVKPIDEAGIVSAATGASRGIVVVEDHRPEGGLGDAVSAVLQRHAIGVPLTHLAVRDVPASATPAEQRADACIDSTAITAAIRRT